MIELTKECSTCKEEKPTDKFRRNKSKRWGLDSQCKLCVSKAGKLYSKDNKDKLRKKNLDNYLKNKEHRKQKAREYYYENQDSVLEKVHSYYDRNKQSIASYKKTYRSENRGKVNALSRKREISKLKRVPSWLSKKELALISGLYTKCKKMSEDTKILHHVDHIIPLQGKLVSGLHVYSNLQIITASENSKKSNKFMI